MKTEKKRGSIYSQALESAEPAIEKKISKEAEPAKSVSTPETPAAPFSEKVPAPALSKDVIEAAVQTSPESVRETKVGFVVSMFPCYDEAFILREMDALSRKMEVRIFSLRRSAQKIVHDQAARLLPHTTYVTYLFSKRVLLAQAYYLIRRPGAYFKALIRLISGNWKCREFLIKNLVFFPKAVYLAKWAEEEGITQLHAYWATYPASAALVASELSGIPFSFTGHAHDIYLNTTHLPEKIHRATFVTTCTSSNKAYLEKLAPGIPEGRIFLNYHGLDLSRFNTPEKKRNEVFQILSVGTLNPHKGFGYLFQALEMLKNENVPFHCTVIGGGPLEAELKTQIQTLGLAQEVTMTGPLKQDQVIPYYKKSDLMILMAQPEWHWGIPNVLIESLAAETPVITTLFGSVEELIQNEKTGLIVSPKDAAGLARAIKRLSENETERLLLAVAGKNLVAENFDLAKKVEEFGGRLSGKKESVSKPEAFNAVLVKNADEPYSQAPANHAGFKRRISGFLSTIFYFVLKNRPRQGTRILCYHRVSDEDQSYVTVSPAAFREQMEWLHRNGYRSASLEDLLSGKTNEKSVVITFDDGYRDNYEFAFPIMKQFGYKGTIFCVSGKIDQAPYLRLSDIREMQAEGFEFGSHTVTHPNLKQISKEEKWKEISGSKEQLEKMLGAPCRYFCYPYGCYDEEALISLRQAGFSAACSNTPGVNKDWGTSFEPQNNPFLLKRTEMAFSDTLFDFEKKMTGAYDILHRLLHSLRGRP